MFGILDLKNKNNSLTNLQIIIIENKNIHETRVLFDSFSPQKAQIRSFTGLKAQLLHFD